MSKKDKKDNVTHIPNTGLIPASDGKKYTSDFVKHCFINSDSSIEEIASQMNLSVELVKYHANQGLKSWYDLKKEHFPIRLQTFMESDLDNLVETHAALDDGHWLTIVQMKSYQEFLKNYYAKNGHLFRMNEDGEISMDTYGLPVLLPLPNTPKHFMALEGYLKMKEGTKGALNQIQERYKTEGKTEIIDVDGFFKDEE
jgi:hypothetical protein